MAEVWLAEHSASEPLRRLPSQQRSRQRVERILDAAGDLVAERGYEATTTSLIARRARVSPGSFYQFFADKRAAVKALSARNLAVFAERLDEALVDDQFAHWWDTVDVAFDIYVDLCRHHPGFRAVRFGDIVDTHLLDPTQDNDSVVASRIASLLHARFGVVDTPALRLALLTTTKVADALIKFAFSRSPEGDEEVLLQGRRMLRIHLEGYVQLAGDTNPAAGSDPS
ncbi:TetR/AcrR family transcriptional regulator [Cryptosporangium sp. NPDC048952]|uniref:TetR/AcrR family transcriptional regulator n=1 Tax=Cryptosporangium sp. NPDC048952 TaxID=3363961 RepID=UPI0037101185